MLNVLFRHIIYWMPVFILLSCVRKDDKHEKLNAPFLNESSVWADSLLNEMSIEEKVGQLLVLKSGLSAPCRADTLLEWLEAGKMGGWIPVDVALQDYFLLYDNAHAYSPVPPLIGTETPINLINIFSDIEQQFPTPATMSSIGDEKLRADVMDLYVRQCQSLGVNFSFSPPVNHILPTDSVYDYHLFESEREVMMLHTLRLMNKLQDNHILSVARDFKDFYPLDTARLSISDSLLLPYYNLTQNGLSGILTDPRLFDMDSIEKLFPYFLRSFLEESMEFGGLLFGAVSGKVTLEALIHAGTDVFVVNDLVPAYDQLLQYAKEGVISKENLNHKVRKILLAKAWSKTGKKPVVLNQEMIERHINSQQYELLIRDLYEQSIVLATNHKSLLPFTHTYKRNFRVFHYGSSNMKVFGDYFRKYADFHGKQKTRKENASFDPLPTASLKYATVVLTLSGENLHPVRDLEFIQSVNTLSRTSKVALVNFGNPLNLQYFDPTVSMIQIFESNPTTQSLAAQLLFGGIKANGRLPLHIADHLPFGASVPTPVTRLKYTIPEEVGIASAQLNKIDRLLEKTMASGASPGGQVLVAKEGKVILSKAFGKQAFKDNKYVSTTDLYDLASITKVAATTLAAMKMYEEKKFNITDSIGYYLPCGDSATISNIQIRQLLIHESGLQPHMPIIPYIMYQDTSGGMACGYFAREKQDSFLIPVADSFYLECKWLDTIWSDVYQLPVRKKPRFRYSDVNFNLLQHVIENKAVTTLDQYLYQHFYIPLGLRRCAYKPLDKVDKSSIVPTHNDVKWRQQLLCGYVHDEAAALMGGVGGNAGLFSNAEDLAVIFQMLLNKGSYGEKQYFEPQTIQYFTSGSHGNHRGLGFDRQGEGNAHCAQSASPDTYGHTGFTGTCVWVDPKEQLIYIFLSNRINSSVYNRRLFKHRIREQIHQVVYDAFNSYDPLLPPLETPQEGPVQDDWLAGNMD